MDRDKREAIEAAGFRVGDAGDFLGLTDDERRMIDRRPLRPELAAEILRCWEEHGDAARQWQVIGEAIRDAVAAERERWAVAFDAWAAGITMGLGTATGATAARLAARAEAFRDAARMLREGIAG